MRMSNLTLLKTFYVVDYVNKCTNEFKQTRESRSLEAITSDRACGVDIFLC